MPLFRFINPTPDNGDATYLFDENPDPTKYEAADKPRPKPAPAVREETS